MTTKQITNLLNRIIVHQSAIIEDQNSLIEFFNSNQQVLGEWVDIKFAANHVHVTERRIRGLLERGHITKRKQGGKVLVNLDEVLEKVAQSQEVE